MKPLLLLMVVLVVVGGCVGSAAPSVAPLRMTTDVIGNTCAAETWITGLIVADPSGQAAIKDDQGVVTPLIWGMHNSAVVELGRRYKIGGQIATWLGGMRRLWACAGADAVIPQ